jgi:formate dehydrogenase subunit delta
MNDNLAQLVRMANQIAANLAHEPDPVAATADHIRLFWDPRMRAGIARADSEALSDIARAALAQLRGDAARA